MEIIKILKKDNKTEINETFESAGMSTYIYYKCEKCGEINSRRKNRFAGDEKDWLCKTCKTKETKKEKYGDENYNNIEKAQQTNLEKFGAITNLAVKENIEKFKEAKRERYGNEYYNNREKAKQTNLNKYGYDNPSKLIEVKELKVKNSLEKYGVSCPQKTDEVKEKIAQTMIEKYGVKTNLLTDEFKEYMKNYMLENYGVEHYSQADEFKEYMKNYMLENYGVEYYSQTDEFKEKTRQTSLERYGVESYTQTEECREKTKKTNLERYGVEHLMSDEDFMKKFLKIREQNYMEKYGVKTNLQLKENIEKARKTFVNNHFYEFKFHSYWDIKPLFGIGDYNGVNYNNKYLFQCKVCGTIFIDHVQNAHKPRCPSCFPKFRSKGEIELANFVKQYVEIIENDRKLIFPKEIDILISSKKIAIEYNGEYWHRDNEREDEKRQLVENMGYEYIVVWENDWLNYKDELKSQLVKII